MKTKVLLLAIFLGTLSASMLWTGLPIYLQQAKSTHFSLSTVYSLATFGSFVFSLFGGLLSDAFSYRKIAVSGNLFVSLLVALIFGLGVSGRHLEAMILLPLLYFGLSLAQIAESVWILKFSGPQGFRNQFLDRAILMIAAKLVGFSLGPLVFDQLGAGSLIACGGLFLVAALLQGGIAVGEPSTAVRADPSSAPNRMATSLPVLKELLLTPAILFSVALNGLLSVPLNALFVTRLTQIGSPSDVSLFWGLAGLCGLAGIVIQKKAKNLSGRRLSFIATAVLCTMVSVAFLADSPKVVILSGSIYVFSSMFFSMQTQLLILQRNKDRGLGTSAGALSCLTDGGVFIGMVLGIALVSVGYMVMLLLLLSMVILRQILFLRLVESDRKQVV